MQWRSIVIFVVAFPALNIAVAVFLGWVTAQLAVGWPGAAYAVQQGRYGIVLFATAVFFALVGFFHRRSPLAHAGVVAVGGWLLWISVWIPLSGVQSVHWPSPALVGVSAAGTLLGVLCSKLAGQQAAA